MNPPAKKVIVVTGPTGAGKTAVAIRLALHFQTEIISADSRQCYRELDIGVARPDPEELAAVPHHFIASHSIRENITAAGFEKYAMEKTAELFKTHDTILMVGGTGLYIRAFCEGLDPIPEIDPEIRKMIVARYTAEGMGWLQNEIKQKDPAFYREGEIQNPQRMMRALEVWEATGHSILDYRGNSKSMRPFTIFRIGLDLPMELLQLRLEERVNAMMERGLPEEVRSLMPQRELNALQTVGYAELFDYFDGKVPLEKAVEAIKLHTRQYAKRQLTWLRKDRDIHWFAPGDIDRMINLVTGR